MKKYFKHVFLFAAFLFVTGAFVGCSDSDNDGPNNPNKPEVTTGKMKTLTLSGIVSDIYGNSLSGVTVKSGTSEVKTNSVGFFTLSDVNVVGSRSVVHLSKDGYFDVTRSLEELNGDTWKITMVNKSDGKKIVGKETFKASAGKTVSVGDVAKPEETGLFAVELPKGGYVYADGGASYNGDVTAEVVYLDPSAEEFTAMMPGGDLKALDANGGSVELISYGMASVVLSDASGKELQLSEGNTAKLTFQLSDVSKAQTARSEIPLWHFDEDEGIWKEEGLATKKSDGTYEGTVSHFSWWNLDYPARQGVVTGKVVDEKNDPVPGVLVHIGQRSVYTNEKGVYTQTVPADEPFNIWIYGKDFDGREGTAVSVNLPNGVKPQQVYTQDLSVPNVYYLTGKVVDQEGKILLAGIQLNWAGYSKSTINKTDGSFKILLPDYNGNASLRIVANGGSKAVNFTIVTKTDKDLGDIVITTLPVVESNNKMVLTYTDNSEIKTIDLPALFAEIDGRQIRIENNREEMDMGDYGMFFIGMDQCDFEKGTCDQVFTEIIMPDIDTDRQGATATFKIDGSMLTARIEGHGHNFDNDDGLDREFLFVVNVTAPIIKRNYVYYNSTPKSAGFPSFTPGFNDTWPALLFEKDGDYGTGGQLYKNGTRADFDALVAQADASGIAKYTKTEGLPVPNEQSPTARYFQDGKYIQIVYHSAYKEVDDWKTYGWWGGSQIIVIAYEKFEETNIVSFAYL